MCFVCYPVFFNPGAFALVNTLPQALPVIPGTNPQEPQDDAVNMIVIALVSYAL